MAEYKVILKKKAQKELNEINKENKEIAAEIKEKLFELEKIHDQEAF